MYMTFLRAKDPDISPITLAKQQVRSMNENTPHDRTNPQSKQEGPSDATGPFSIFGKYRVMSASLRVAHSPRKLGLAAISECHCLLDPALTLDATLELELL